MDNPTTDKAKGSYGVVSVHIHAYHIAIHGDEKGGYYGRGETKAIAKRRLHEAGGNIPKCRVYEFTSSLSFAPDIRDALENEADCWVNEDGSLGWSQCANRGMVPGSFLGAKAEG